MPRSPNFSLSYEPDDTAQPHIIHDEFVDWVDTNLPKTTTTAGAARIGMLSVAGSTYETVEDMQNTFHSAGWVSGGVVTDAGGATVDVAVGVGLLRSTDDSAGDLYNIDWGAESGIATTTDSANYVIVEWNAGAPQIETPLPTTDTSNGNTTWLLGVVVNEGGTLHITAHKPTVGDHAVRMIERLHAVDHIARDNAAGGLIIASTGTNDITMTAGTLWLGLDDYDVSAIDTAAAGTFDSYYNNGAGFTKVGTGIGAWDALQYENSGTLTTLTNNRFANLWWYVELDGGLVMMYGSDQYATEAQAEEEGAPVSVPTRLTEHGLLIGRFIFQKSDTIAGLVQDVFSTTFTGTGANSHTELTDIGTNTHAQIDAFQAGLATQLVDLYAFAAAQG